MKFVLMVFLIAISTMANAWYCTDHKGSTIEVTYNFLKPTLGYEAVIILNGPVIDSYFNDFRSLEENYVDPEYHVSRFQYDQTDYTFYIMADGVEPYKTSSIVQYQHSLEVIPYKKGVKLQRFFAGSEYMPNEFWSFQFCD